MSAPKRKASTVVFYNPEDSEVLSRPGEDTSEDEEGPSYHHNKDSSTSGRKSGSRYLPQMRSTESEGIYVYLNIYQNHNIILFKKQRNNKFDSYK